MLAETPAADLAKIFSAQELTDAGTGAGRAASLAARYAAKEACVKLFPRELALAQVEPADFSVTRDAYGAPQIATSPKAQALLDRHRLSGISVSLTHDRTSASAVALALPASTDGPAGRARALQHAAAAQARRHRQPSPRVRPRRPGRGDRAPGAGALRAPVAARRRVPQVSLAVGAAEAGAGARRERRHVHPRVRRRQGRADPHRAFRQLGSGDGRRHSAIPAGAAAASTSCAVRSSRAGSTRW